MNVESHTELDSHANMPVVGKHAYIIDETGKKVDVSPFTPDYQPLTVPLVDATVRYDNPYNRKTYILVLCNALYVPSMDNNNRNMSKSKGWILQGSLLMLWMDENSSQQSNKKNADDENLLNLFDVTTKLAQIVPTWVIQTGALNR